MTSRRWETTIGRSLAALVLVAVAVLGGAAQADAARKPDLRIDGGKVKLAAGALVGSVRVENDGRKAARGSVTAVSIRKGGAKQRVAGLRTGGLRPGAVRRVAVEASIPRGIRGGSWQVLACADRKDQVAELREGNNCAGLGKVTIPPPGPQSSVPGEPVPFQPDTPLQLQSGESAYWVNVPPSYDSTHQTPSRLLVWLHGCGGYASGDVWTVSPSPRSWITVAVGGREGACWKPGPDRALVKAAIADVKTHFNIAPRRVILGGYSSGGDLGYRTAFYDSTSYAGLLAVNTSPFRDTGSSAQNSLAAATNQFHVVHLAHLQDTVYPIAGVRQETNAMIDAGFPLERIEVAGNHYDPPGAMVNGQPVPGTDADIRSLLLPHMDDGWLAPP